jgi:hypothetical protein
VKNGDNTPAWVPDWMPSAQTLGYISTGVTAGLLILVVGYLAFHFAAGRSAAGGATVAAGVGVGGAGAA